MRYLGGKAKVGKALAALIAPQGRPYIEPFCGALGVMRHVGYGVAADSDPEMIALWKAVQAGWQPPREVSRQEYYRVQADASAPPELRAFVKHGCSFGGKSWGGYAAGFHIGTQPRAGGVPSHTYVQTACNVISKIYPRIAAVDFVCSDYRNLAIPDGAVVYCDPPYAGTEEIKDSFDSYAFWDWALELSDRAAVLVSEYSAPYGWEPVWGHTIQGIRQGRNAQKTRSVERLWARSLPLPWAY